MQIRRLIVLWLCGFCVLASAQTSVLRAQEKVIIDTDIGDDIDDAFAVALALRSPELNILGITTTSGDTKERAALLDRLLSEVKRQDIPVAIGRPTPVKAAFTQRTYAEGAPATHKNHPDAVDFTLEMIRKYPGQVTLVAIGPLFNVGAMIGKDPATFRLLKRVVMMGGSVERSSGEFDFDQPKPPVPEWNIVNDVRSAQKLFASGVPIVMFPLDCTEMKLDEVKRAILFRQATPLTNALAALYYEWGGQTPTLFDPMTIVSILQPQICPVTPMRIHVDDDGLTRRENGPPNAQVCLHSDQDAFFRFYIARLIAQARPATQR